MSDQVGNPEDRFSQVAAHFAYLSMLWVLTASMILVTYEKLKQTPVYM